MCKRVSINVSNRSQNCRFFSTSLFWALAIDLCFRWEFHSFKIDCLSSHLRKTDWSYFFWRIYDLAWNASELNMRFEIQSFRLSIITGIASFLVKRVGWIEERAFWIGSFFATIKIAGKSKQSKLQGNRNWNFEKRNRNSSFALFGDCFCSIWTWKLLKFTDQYWWV